MSPLSPHAHQQLPAVILQLGLITLAVQLVGLVVVAAKHGPGTVMLHLVAGLLLSIGLVAFGIRGRVRPRIPHARRQRFR